MLRDDLTSKELLRAINVAEQVSVSVGMSEGFLRVRVTKVEAQRIAKRMGDRKVRVVFDGGMIMIGTGAFRWEPGVQL